jgi:hypothetical protein
VLVGRVERKRSRCPMSRSSTREGKSQRLLLAGHRHDAVRAVDVEAFRAAFT